MSESLGSMDEWLQKMIDDAAVREAASVELQRGIDELIQEAVAAERERCANRAHDLLTGIGIDAIADEVSDLIRKGE